jgi:hypothetical protein
MLSESDEDLMFSIPLMFFNLFPSHSFFFPRFLSPKPNNALLPLSLIEAGSSKHILCLALSFSLTHSLPDKTKLSALKTKLNNFHKASHSLSQSLSVSVSLSLTLSPRSNKALISSSLTLSPCYPRAIVVCIVFSNSLKSPSLFDKIKLTNSSSSLLSAQNNASPKHSEKERLRELFSLVFRALSFSFVSLKFSHTAPLVWDRPSSPSRSPGQ